MGAKAYMILGAFVAATSLCLDIFTSGPNIAFLLFAGGLLFSIWLRHLGRAPGEVARYSDYEFLRAKLAEVERENERLDRELNVPQMQETIGIERFQAAEARASSAEKTVLEMREGLERLIATYSDFQDGNGDPCPDVAFARSLLTERRNG